MGTEMTDRNRLTPDDIRFLVHRHTPWLGGMATGLLFFAVPWLPSRIIGAVLIYTAGALGTGLLVGDVVAGFRSMPKARAILFTVFSIGIVGLMVTPWGWPWRVIAYAAWIVTIALVDVFVVGNEDGS